MLLRSFLLSFHSWLEYKIRYRNPRGRMLSTNIDLPPRQKTVIFGTFALRFFPNALPIHCSVNTLSRYPLALLKVLSGILRPNYGSYSVAALDMPWSTCLVSPQAIARVFATIRRYINNYLYFVILSRRLKVCKWVIWIKQKDFFREVMSDLAHDSRGCWFEPVVVSAKFRY